MSDDIFKCDKDNNRKYQFHSKIIPDLFALDYVQEHKNISIKINMTHPHDHSYA